MADSNCKAAPTSAGALKTLTAEQIDLLFESIATKAGALVRHCSFASANAGSLHGDEFMIAASMAESIGALADYAIGGTCFGDIANWMVVNDFDERGRSA